MSTSVNFAERRVEGGFFLHRKCERAPFEWGAVGGRKYEIVGTISGSECGIRDALIALIEAAKERVFIASFLIGDDAVISSLLRAASRLKGGVYVICALDRRSLQRGLELEGEEGVPPEERRKDFRRLTEGGVYVRGHEHCHAKFAVADNEVALVGSANFVLNSFEFNNELDVVVRDSVQVQQVARLFTHLWYAGCKWEILPGEAYRVATRQREESPAIPSNPVGEENEFVWTNGRGATHLLQAIQQAIRHAQRELTIASYSIVGMAENRDIVFDEIESAIHRGVDVRLHLRQRNARPAEMIDVMAAAQMGVQIHGDIRNHAKGMVADHSVALAFSANLDAIHGLTSGVEAGVRLEEPHAVRTVARYFDYLIATADTRFVRNPSATELDQSLAARWHRRWHGPLVVAVKGPESHALREAASTGVCLFESADRVLRLHIGNVCAVLRLGQDQMEARIDGLTETEGVGARLSEWMSGRKPADESQQWTRGFFRGRLDFAE